MSIITEKLLGETPLECLERTRREQGIAADVPMTYAGRLDPMASGKLLILIGEECKDKEKYLGFDKEYEIGVLFGVSTDTGDMLGLVTEARAATQRVHNVYTAPVDAKSDTIPLAKFVAKFEQEYPAYSSKAVSSKPGLAKRQLHDLARADELPDEMPTKDVEIYSIEELGKGETSGSKIATQAISNILKVNGDFRQDEIIAGWEKFGQEYGETKFLTIKLRVKCSSGTYMRSLAERIGREAGTVAMASGIVRTKIGDF